jgi:hypothetical protein
MTPSRLPNPYPFVLIVLIVVVVTAFVLTRQRTAPLSGLSGLNAQMIDPARRPAQLVNLTDGELKEVVLILERTSCYGSCPAYKLTLHGDGRVEYEGGKNVKLTSKKEGHVQSGDLKKILAAFDKADFFSIKPYTYDTCTCTVCTDMPTAITEIRAKGMSHRVEHYYGCRCAPKELWELEESIDGIVGTRQWTGDVSKQGPVGTTCFDK